MTNPAPQRAVIGCLLAHPKNWPTERIKSCVEWLKGWLKGQSNAARQIIPNVHTAQSEWFHHYVNGTDPKEWVRNTLRRVSPVLGTRQYRMVVVPGETCGSVTAIIVSQALALGLSVKMLKRGDDGKPVLVNIKAVTARDPKDMESGWVLTPKE
jgi:hypothetical protein